MSHTAHRYVRTHTHVWWTNFPKSGFRVCPPHVELHHTGGNRNHYRYSETFRRPPFFPWSANHKPVAINTARLNSIKCPHPHTITPNPHIPPHTSCQFFPPDPSTLTLSGLPHALLPHLLPLLPFHSHPRSRCSVPPLPLPCSRSHLMQPFQCQHYLSNVHSCLVLGEPALFV